MWAMCDQALSQEEEEMSEEVNTMFPFFMNDTVLRYTLSLLY